MNQLSKIENQEIDPHKYSQLIFDSDAKAIKQMAVIWTVVLEQLLDTLHQSTEDAS